VTDSDLCEEYQLFAQAQGRSALDVFKESAYRYTRWIHAIHSWMKHHMPDAFYWEYDGRCAGLVTEGYEMRKKVMRERGKDFLKYAKIGEDVPFPWNSADYREDRMDPNLKRRSLR
jgi:hypothetical protein